MYLDSQACGHGLFFKIAEVFSAFYFQVVVIEFQVRNDGWSWIMWYMYKFGLVVGTGWKFQCHVDQSFWMIDSLHRKKRKLAWFELKTGLCTTGVEDQPKLSLNGPLSLFVGLKDSVFTLPWKTNWAAAGQNEQNDLCAQQMIRSA